MDMLGPIIVLFVLATIAVPWIAYKALRPLPIVVRLTLALPLILSPYWIGNNYELSNQTIAKLFPFAVLMALGAFWSLLPQWYITSATERLRSPYIQFDFDNWNRRRRGRR